MAGFYTEASYENAVIKIFTDILGYQYIYAPELERDYRSPFYEDVLVSKLRRLNPKMNDEAIQNALYKLHNFDNGSLLDKSVMKRESGESPEQTRCCKFHNNFQELICHCL